MELKKVKKSRKIIFSILSIFCIVLSFLSPIGVYAADNETLVDRFGLSDDDVLNNQDFANSDEYIDGLTPYIYNTQVSYTNFTSYITNNLFELPTPLEGLDTVYMSYNNFFMWEQNNTSSALMFLPNDSFMSYEGGKFYFYVNPETYSSDTGITQSNNYSLNIYNFSSGVFSNRGSYAFGFASRVTIDGTIYYRLNQFDSRRVFLTNMPIYYNGGSALTTLEGVDNINYSPLGQTTDYSDILDHSDAYEGSTIYLEYTSFNSGYLNVYLSSDNYQKDNDYFVKVKGYSQYNVQHVANAYYSVYAQNGKKIQNLYNLPGTVTFNSGEFSTNSGGKIITMDDFGNDGHYQIKLEDLNKSLLDSATENNCYQLAYGLSNISTGITKSLAGIAGTFMGTYMGVKYDFLDTYDFEYKPQGVIYSFDAYICHYDENNNLIEKAFDGFTLDMVNASVTNRDYHLTSSDDLSNALGSEVIPNSYVNTPNSFDYSGTVTNNGGNDISSSSGGSSSSQGGDSNNNITTGDNNQVVNTGSTNVTVNNDNGTAKYVPTILNKLLPNSEGDGGLSNDVQDLVNSNGWVTFLKTTYSFIPAAFWDKIVLYFGACLTITACAFLLRIILDLL